MKFCLAPKKTEIMKISRKNSELKNNMIQSQKPTQTNVALSLGQRNVFFLKRGIINADSLVKMLRVSAQS